MKKLSVLGLTLIVFASASIAVSQANETVKPNSKNPDNAVITRLQMRDRIVTISQADNMTTYSIEDMDGNVLSANLTENELAQKYPQLHEKLRPAVASPDGSGGIGVWAGTFPN